MVPVIKMIDDKKNTTPIKQHMPKVLVVDDSKSIRAYLESILKEAGYKVRCAVDGQECLDFVKEEEPDVILLDIEMPRISGLKVLDMLRLTDSTYSIILITNLSSLEHRISGLNRGADDYIAKPFDKDELIARVGAAIRTANLKKMLTNEKSAVENTLNTYNKALNKVAQQKKTIAISKLAAGLSHEINNPLSFVQSNLNTLKKYSRIMTECTNNFINISETIDTDNIKDSEQLKGMLQWMKKSKLKIVSDDIEPLISDTLEGIGRISILIQRLIALDQASFYSSPERVDINDLIMSLNKSSLLELPANINFTLSLYSDPILITGRKEQLSIAINNIIENAIFAIKDKGEISLKTSQDNGLAKIEIRDTGNGIPEEVISHIFEPFFTTSEAHDMVGLGLTVSEQLIHIHGGQLSIDSKPANGTCVTVLLPLEN